MKTHEAQGILVAHQIAHQIGEVEKREDKMSDEKCDGAINESLRGW